jgi:hypothetical protein
MPTNRRNGFRPNRTQEVAGSSPASSCGVRKLGSACKSARCGSADASTNTKPPREFANPTAASGRRKALHARNEAAVAVIAPRRSPVRVRLAPSLRTVIEPRAASVRLTLELACTCHSRGAEREDCRVSATVHLKPSCRQMELAPEKGVWRQEVYALIVRGGVGRSADD